MRFSVRVSSGTGGQSSPDPDRNFLQEETMRGGIFQGERPFQPDRQNGDILRKRSGGGHLILFGAPFFITGLMAMLTGMEIIPSRSGEFGLSSLTALCFGVIFMGIGMVLILGRSVLTIDRQRTLVTLWYGLLFPMKRVTRSLDLIDAVGIDRHEGKRDAYTVDLRGGAPVEAFTVERTGDYRLARQTAEMLSRFVGKPLLELPKEAS
jgi:hypothetical protein